MLWYRSDIELVRREIFCFERSYSINGETAWKWKLCGNAEFSGSLFERTPSLWNAVSLLSSHYLSVISAVKIVHIPAY